jgi:hypothetical protein
LDTDHTLRLTTACHQSGFTSVNVHTLKDERIIFIFDEAQQSYSDQGLWLGFIKSVSGMRGGARMCLFSSFGSPVNGPLPEDFPDGSPSVIFGAQQRVSLMPSHEKDRPDFGLFFSEDKFQDATARFCRDEHLPFTLSSGAQSRVYKATNGHPGGVRGILTFLQKASYPL